MSARTSPLGTQYYAQQRSLFSANKRRQSQLTYKNINYDFIDGQVVQYGDLSKLLFFDLAPDMLKMINDIVNSHDVSKHAQIIDAST
jgi:hypothetical protein